MEFGQRYPGGIASPWTSDALVRGELFSVERLQQHAVSLAEAQPVAGPGAADRPVAGRVRDNYRHLSNAYRVLSRTVADGPPLTPAGQWLVDNYHVIEAQIRDIRGDLPAGYYRQLPKLATGPFAGYPRVLGIAWAFVAHTDSRFDCDLLCRFLGAYQRVQPLTVGELWAVSITLRIVLVENLRRAATRIIDHVTQRHQANLVADAFLRVEGELDAALPGVLEQVPPGPLHATFAVQLVQRLHRVPRQIRHLRFQGRPLALIETLSRSRLRCPRQKRLRQLVESRIEGTVARKCQTRRADGQAQRCAGKEYLTTVHSTHSACSSSPN